MNPPELIEIGQLSKWNQLAFGAKCARLVLDVVESESRDCASGWIADAEAVVATHTLQGKGGSPQMNDEESAAWMAARICSYAAAWWNMPRPDMINAIVNCSAHADPSCIPLIWSEFNTLYAASQERDGTNATISLSVFGELSDFTDDKSSALLNAIRKLLSTDSVQITDVRSGSIDVLLALDIGMAEKLFWAIKSGELRDLDVVDAHLIGEAAADALIEAKRAQRNFDVFLCHNSDDKSQVKDIGNRLMRFGLLPWLDEWALRPGLPWQRTLEGELQCIQSAAVFVGCLGIGPWQNLEIEAFIRQFIKRSCPVIPVVLPECQGSPSLPVFLEGMTWVDFRQPQPPPLSQLVWGITGKQPCDRWRYA